MTETGNKEGLTASGYCVVHDCDMQTCAAAGRACQPMTPAFMVRVEHPTWHTLKVEPPYFDAVFEGHKPFEVRKNDRAYQRGDMLRLREYDPARCTRGCRGSDPRCPSWTGRECVRRVSFVYSGDPRFGGIEPGCVVLGLVNDADNAPEENSSLSPVDPAGGDL